MKMMLRLLLFNKYDDAQEGPNDDDEDDGDDVEVVVVDRDDGPCTGGTRL